MLSDYEPDPLLTAAEQEQDMRDEIESNAKVMECHKALKKIIDDINWHYEEDGIDWLKDKGMTPNGMAVSAFMAVLEVRMDDNLDSQTNAIRILLSCYIQLWGRYGEEERELMSMVFSDPFGRGYGELFKQTAAKIAARKAKYAQ